MTEPTASVIERLRGLCHPNAECLPDGARLTAIIHAGHEAADLLEEAQKEITRLQQALSQAGDNIELAEAEHRGYERGLRATSPDAATVRKAFTEAARHAVETVYVAVDRDGCLDDWERENCVEKVRDFFMDELPPAAEGEGVERCPVCSWPYAEIREKGCVPGDCSYRPQGTAEYERVNRNREALATPPAPSAGIDREAIANIIREYVNIHSYPDGESDLDDMSIVTAADAILALLSSQQADRDALRYRYLRNRPEDTIGKGGVFAGMTPPTGSGGSILTEDDLDRAVDEAMLAARPTQVDKSPEPPKE